MQRFFNHAQDPVSCGTHTIGAVAAGLGGFLFLIRAVWEGAPVLSLAAAMCFCLSMVALYSASAVYHFYPGDIHSGGVNLSRSLPIKIEKKDCDGGRESCLAVFPGHIDIGILIASGFGLFSVPAKDVRGYK